jgi:hypothetical protein
MGEENEECDKVAMRVVVIINNSKMVEFSLFMP